MDWTEGLVTNIIGIKIKTYAGVFFGSEFVKFNLFVLGLEGRRSGGESESESDELVLDSDDELEDEEELSEESESFSSDSEELESEELDEDDEDPDSRFRFRDFAGGTDACFVFLVVDFGAGVNRILVYER